MSDIRNYEEYRAQVLDSLGEDYTVEDLRNFERWRLKVLEGLSEIADPEAIAEAVDAWLDAHPEATTTIEDGAVTTAKLTDGAVTTAKLAADVQLDAPTKADAIVETATGEIASFDDGGDDMPMKSLVVNIEPVQSGTGDPSPTNIRPISGWDEVKLNRTGKNLVDVADGNVNETAKVTPYFILPKGTYSYSCDVMRTDGGYCRLSLYKENNAIAETSSNYSGNTYARGTLTFTLAEDTSVALGLQFLTSYSVINYKNVQLELGSTATDYEPYQGSTKQISLPSTVYGGEVSVVDGNGTSTMGMVDLGTLNWGKDTVGDNWAFYASVPDAKAYYYAENINILCEKYKAMQVTNQYVNDLTCFLKTNHQLFVIDKTYTDPADFKASLNGIHLCYELTTPTDLTTTPTEVKSLLGDNNVWADAGTVEVEYRADTTLAFNKLLARIEALES